MKVLMRQSELCTELFFTLAALVPNRQTRLRESLAFMVLNGCRCRPRLFTSTCR